MFSKYLHLPIKTESNSTQPQKKKLKRKQKEKKIEKCGPEPSPMSLRHSRRIEKEKIADFFRVFRCWVFFLALFLFGGQAARPPFYISINGYILHGLQSRFLCLVSYGIFLYKTKYVREAKMAYGGSEKWKFWDWFSASNLVGGNRDSLCYTLPIFYF